MGKKTYARCVGFIDDKPIGSYTLHKEYEVEHTDTPNVFFIEQDNGEEIACWWHGDPDVLWERVEREDV